MFFSLDKTALQTILTVINIYHIVSKYVIMLV